MPSPPNTERQRASYTIAGMSFTKWYSIDTSIFHRSQVKAKAGSCMVIEVTSPCGDSSKQLETHSAATEVAPTTMQEVQETMAHLETAVHVRVSMGRNAQRSSISVRLPKSATDLLDWKWLERVHQYGGRRYRLGVRFWSRGLRLYTRKGLAISSPGSCASDQWVAGAGTKAPPLRTLCGRLAIPSLAATLLATPTLAALPEMHRKSSMTRRIRDPQKKKMPARFVPGIKAEVWTADWYAPTMRASALQYPA